MFRFLSFFKKNKDEQLNENEYDFNEAQTTDIGIEGAVNTQKSVVVEKASGALQEPFRTSSVDSTRVDRARISDIEDELNNMVNDPEPRSGEVQTEPDQLGGDSFFDVNGKTLLGKGGENFVYDIPDDTSVVGRVAIEPLIEQFANVEGQPSMEETTAKEMLQAKLAAENATYDELCTYFGNDQVPQTTRSVRQVPTSREFLEAIYKAKRRDLPNIAVTPTEMLTIVAIQEKVPEINDDKSLDVQGGLAEARDPKVMNTENYRHAYEAATQALICDPESASFDLDQFLVLHPDLRKTVEQADTNPKLKGALKDFVQRAMQYSRETGKSLDLNGAKNILFFENTDDNIDENADNPWSYKLVDATSPYAEAALRRTKELMEKVIAKEHIEDHIDRHLLRSAVNYQRTLNGLAKQFGIDDHLDMIPHASSITPSEFWDILYDGGPPENSSPEQVAA